jgi:hypothetical protein
VTDDIRTMLAACLDHPAADDKRLVLADALRESGGDTLERFGRFLWAGVTLARYRGHEPADEGWFTDAIQTRDDTAKGVCEWVTQGLGWGDWPCGWDTDAQFPDRVTYSLIPQRNGRGPARSQYADRDRRQLVFERGMLHTIRLPYAELLEHAESALHGWPVQRFEPLDLPGVSIQFECIVDPTLGPRVSPVCGWCVVARLRVKERRTMLAGKPAIYPAHDVVTPIFGLGQHEVMDSHRNALVRRVRRAMGLQTIRLRGMAVNEWPRTSTADIYEGFEELRPAS